MARQPLDREQLNLIAQGHAAFQLLWAGVDLGLYDLLAASPGATREAVAEGLSIQAQPARILLVGLTALGVIEKCGTAYFNSQVAEELLVRDKPGSMAKVLGWQRHIVYGGLEDFVASLKENRNVGLRRFPGKGNTLYERLQSHPETEKIFQEAMSSLSSHANPCLVEAVDLSQVTHLLDVGGGDGTNAIAFVRRFPSLRVTVFDSASVCGLAEENVRCHAFQGQIDTHVGNLFTTPYPSGVDAILYSHMFTIYSPERNGQIIRKSFDALPPGGVVLIFGMMGNEDDTGPIGTALGSPYFLTIATGEGMLYSWLDFQGWFKDAGFASVRRVTGLPQDHSLLIATK
ncbi:MAG: methyltransferase domain-containing protein [Lentisphaerae bacterium]|nr:methyltransferase domain-containing protein [Lentisphaerota bacterium]